MTTRIVAGIELANSPQDVFGFLADLRNHALLAPGSVELRSCAPADAFPTRAVVSLRGPLAIRRTARTAIVDARSPTLIAGRATIGRRTRAAVEWTIAGRPRASHVSLRVTVEATGTLDGALLRLGGRRWLERRLARALTALAAQLAQPALARAGSSRRLRPALEPAA